MKNLYSMKLTTFTIGGKKIIKETDIKSVELPIRLALSMNYYYSRLEPSN